MLWEFSWIVCCMGRLSTTGIVFSRDRWPHKIGWGKGSYALTWTVKGLRSHSLVTFCGPPSYPLGMKRGWQLQQQQRSCFVSVLHELLNKPDFVPDFFSHITACRLFFNKWNNTIHALKIKTVCCYFNILVDINLHKIFFPLYRQPFVNCAEIL